VLNYNKYWLLPGGKVEEGETVEETLVREVKEETNCDVNANTAIPFFYQEQLEQNTDKSWTSKGYELRFMVKLEKFNAFVADPDNGDITKVK
jgi:8-oxo-dGTP pyrophosphatase MutT (NUDIX family)